MRVRYALLSLCLSQLTQIAAASEAAELPPLELLGYIADFSDDEEGWVDPQELEELFSLGSDAADAPGSEDTNHPAVSTDSGAPDTAAAE